MASSPSLVCPYCFKQSTHEIEGEAARYDLACPECKKPFAAVIMTVRAKSGQQNKKAGRRVITIRGSHLTGAEDLITVAKSGTGDVEARGGDLISITYAVGKGGALGRAGALQNYKVGQWWELARPNPGCMGCGAVAGIALAVVTVAGANLLR